MTRLIAVLAVLFIAASIADARPARVKAFLEARHAFHASYHSTMAARMASRPAQAPAPVPAKKVMPK